MARTFRVELSMREAPADAQARAATALKDPARAVGLRLKNRGARELAYRDPEHWLEALGASPVE
jgi:hypothetical protein